MNTGRVRLASNGPPLIHQAMKPLVTCSVLILICSALAACVSDEDAGGPGLGRDGPGGHRDGPPRHCRTSSSVPQASRSGPPPPPPTPWWTGSGEADTDHDGQVSRDEFRQDAVRFFRKLDTNHDGVIDGAELAQYEQDIAPEILPKLESLHAEEGMDPALTYGDPNNTDNRPDGSRPRRQGPARTPTPRGIGVQGAAVYSLINTPEPVAAADAQFDGRITEAEAVAAADRRFTLLDKTGAGVLTLKGLPKTPLQIELLKREKQALKRRGQPPAPPAT